MYKLFLNPLSGNFTKWPNTLKQFVGNLPTNWLSVFGYFVGLALKGLTEVYRYIHGLSPEIINEVFSIFSRYQERLGKTGKVQKLTIIKKKLR